MNTWKHVFAPIKFVLFSILFLLGLLRVKLKRKPRRALYALPALALLAALPARAQVTPTTIFALTNLPTYVEAASTSNVFNGYTNSAGFPTNNVLSVRQGTGVAFQFEFAGTNAANATGITINFVPCYDGTNWATNSANFITFTNIVPNGNNITINATNFQKYVTDNALYITPWNIINGNAAHGGIFISNVVASFGNLVPGSGL